RLGHELHADFGARQRFEAVERAVNRGDGRAPGCESLRYYESLDRAAVARDQCLGVLRNPFLKLGILHQLRPTLRGPSCSVGKPVTPPDADSSSSRCVCHWPARRLFSGLSIKSPSRTSPFSTCDFSSSSICARIRMVGGS